MERLELGLIIELTPDPDRKFADLVALGLRTCQLSCWNPQLYSPQNADRVNEAAQRHGVEVSTLWAGHTGRTAWNFTEGPATIGLVPAATRAERLDQLKQGAGFGKRIGAPSITTHVGFIPEDSNDPVYIDLLGALREVAGACRDEGLGFWFETGQETPITLLRTIEDTGLDNLGINLDPANLLLYGKANPIDALDVFGSHVRGIHAKDGHYPTNGRELGHETPLGSGRVDFPCLIPKLKGLGFTGRVTIEREISGPQQIKDIKSAIALLTPLL